MSDYDYYTRGSKTLDDVKNMNDHLLENTQKIIDKIEKCIGEEKSAENT